MIGGGGLQAALGFIANLVLVWHLSAEDFGKFAIIQADVTLMGAFFNFHSDSLILREDEKELDRHRLGQYSAMLVSQTLVVAFSSILTLYFMQVLTVEAIILLVVTLALTWINFEVHLFEREFHYKNLSILESSSQFGGHFFAIVGVFFGFGAIVLYLRGIINVLILFVGLIKLRALKRLPFRWLKLGEWKIIVNRVKGFWADGIAEGSLDRILTLLVGGIAGEQVTGYFFQAKRLAITPHQLLQPFAKRIFYNYLSNQIQTKNRKKTFFKMFFALLLVLVPIALGVVLLSGAVIPFLFGEDWRPVVPMLTAMTGVIIAMTPFGMLKSYFMSFNNMRPFIIFGRGGQYIGFFLVIGMVYFMDFNIGIGLSVAFSMCYLLGIIMPVGYIFKSNKPLIN